MSVVGFPSLDLAIPLRAQLCNIHSTIAIQYEVRVNGQCVKNVPYSSFARVFGVKFCEIRSALPLAVKLVCSGSPLHLGVVLRCFCPVCQLKCEIRLAVPEFVAWDLAIYSIIVYW